IQLFVTAILNIATTDQASVEEMTKNHPSSTLNQRRPTNLGARRAFKSLGNS
ncbi:hypothetical protein FRC03_003687, partial [Tulasnella sp. 419]